MQFVLVLFNIYNVVMLYTETVIINYTAHFVYNINILKYNEKTLQEIGYHTIYVGNSTVYGFIGVSLSEPHTLLNTAC